MDILGIDVGGSGIKGALVNVETGELAAERHRIPTPQPATPEAMVEVMVEIVNHFDYKGKIGVGFPSAVVNGVVRTAANIDKAWIGVDGDALITERTGCSVTMLNDADAAGLAEMRFGAGKNSKGVAFVVTLGTGIGTGMFVDGKLVPNTELGHIYLPNQPEDAEQRAASSAKEREGLSYKDYAVRVDEYLDHLYGLFFPTMFILGGGISKKHEKFIPRLTVEAEVVPALLRNHAGIIGAAIAASERD